MTKDNDIIEGVIYPLQEEDAFNILNNNKKVFVKYLPHEPSKKTVQKLKSGLKIYFYISKKNKSIVGDAIIKNILFMDFQDILSNYKNQLFISEDKFRLYSKGREHKKAQNLELKDINKYQKKVIVKVPITMAGMYVTTSNKKKIGLK